MSGHSKWSTIKHKKAVRDHARGNLFTKAAKNIAVAVKKGNSPDPEANFSLRLAIDQARAINMPKDNIERAIEHGAGRAGGQELEELVLEAYGEGGVGVIIQVVADNRNRAVAEIKNILEKGGGRLVEPGSVMYQFDTVAWIEVTPILNDEDQLTLIDAGAFGFEQEEKAMVITCDPSSAQAVTAQLASMGYAPTTVTIGYTPKTQSTLQAGGVELVETLLAHDDVQGVYTT